MPKIAAPIKDQRQWHIRVEAVTDEKVKHAAEVCDESASEFIRQAAEDRARKVMEKLEESA